jgi:hypothetical protein
MDARHRVTAMGVRWRNAAPLQVVAISDRQVARGASPERHRPRNIGFQPANPCSTVALGVGTAVAISRLRSRVGTGEDDRVMAIQGVITTNDVLRHPVLIVAQFGLGTYFRCCKAIVLGQRTTFLACAFR